MNQQIDMHAELQAALAELAGELPALPPLAPRQLEQLAAYIGLVLQYNKAAQLTGLRRPAVIARELGAESLRLLALGAVPPGTQLLDLGSGNGSPVVPLALASPQADCYASEVRERRISFLRVCAAQLRLPNLRVLDGPVQQLAPAAGGRWDVLTSRAFAPPARLLPLAVKLLGGAGELRGFLGAEAGELEQLAPQHGFRIAALELYRPGEKPRHVYRLVLNG